MITIKDSINLFLESKVKNSVKPGTYGYYEQNYRIIMDFCKLNNFIYLTDLPENVNLLFIDYLKNIRKVGNGTVNKRIEKLKQLLKFNKIYFDWFKDKKLSEPIKTFDLIPELELKKIINYINNLDDSEINLTYKVLIFLFIDTGSRIDELLNIQLKNIDLIERTILLTHTKTNNHRFVFFNEYTCLLIKKYIAIKNDRIYLFYNFRVDSRLLRGAVVRFLNRLKKELNIINLHPHMFRHTFATLLIENEAPIVLISKLLGHCDVKITMRYVHQSKKLLKREFDRYFPSLLK